ncbi:MAG: HIT family protein [Mucilaginibacter sp.]
MTEKRIFNTFQSLNMTACPFCTLPHERVKRQNDPGLVIRDGYPISPGHTLIIPKRHIASFFQLQKQEHDALMRLVEEAKLDLDEEFKPDAYNIGINDGPVAGQTVPHLHIHLIPRYQGDQEDPRGGVRWLIPEKAKYWTA